MNYDLFCILDRQVPIVKLYTSIWYSGTCSCILSVKQSSLGTSNDTYCAFGHQIHLIPQ